MTVTGLLVLLFAGFLKYFAEFGLEVWDVVLDDVPDDVVANCQIAMSQSVACSYNVSPLNIWIRLSDMFRDACCGFTDELQIM